MSYRFTEPLDVTWWARNRGWHNRPTERRRIMADIPQAWRNLTLDDLPKTKEGRTVRHWCTRWNPWPHSGLSTEDPNNNRGLGLWLAGRPGRGKSTMACIAANHISDLGWSTKFTTSAGLYALSLMIVKEQDEEERERLQRAYDSYTAGWGGWKLVVLDDLGKEHKTATNWAQDNLDVLFRNRYSDMAPTIVTTNWDLEDEDDAVKFANVYSESLLSYIHEAFQIVYVDGKDRRRRAGR